MRNKNEYELLDIDLQLFAGDDDLNDDTPDYDDDDAFDYDDETDTDDEVNSEDDTDDSDDSNTSDADAADKVDNEKNKAKKESGQQDKVRNALIEQKRINKMLKEKLDLIEQKEKERDRDVDQQSKKKALVNKYLDKGYDEEDAEIEATKQLETESMRHTVKKLAFITEHQDTLTKYPDARKNVDRLIKLQADTGWSIDKICNVEFGVKENAFDSKVKNDQAERIKQQKKRLSTPAGGQTTIQSTKLDPEDERAYQFYAKKHPGVSRKQYAENLGISTSQKIPHDKWDS